MKLEQQGGLIPIANLTGNRETQVRVLGGVPGSEADSPCDPGHAH